MSRTSHPPRPLLEVDALARDVVLYAFDTSSADVIVRMAEREAVAGD